MYFDRAVMTISEIGDHGDDKLTGAEFDRDDRAQRIDKAAYALCDWVFEHLCQENDGGFNLGIFKQEHLPEIAHMCAVAMAAQFDFELERELSVNEAF